MSYKVQAWSWCADYCKKNQWNPHDSYFWNKANLEYRRQHNIFEVEDKVVYIHSHFDSSIMTLRKVSASGFPQRVREHDHGVSIYDVRHVTPEEIKADKRLEGKA